MGLSTTTGMPALMAAIAWCACTKLADATTTRSSSRATNSSMVDTTVVCGKSAFACAARSGFAVWIATTSNPQPFSNGA